MSRAHKEETIGGATFIDGRCLVCNRNSCWHTTQAEKQAKAAIRTYHSDALGAVTIPEE